MRGTFPYMGDGIIKTLRSVTEALKAFEDAELEPRDLRHIMEFVRQDVMTAPSRQSDPEITLVALAKRAAKVAGWRCPLHRVRYDQRKYTLFHCPICDKWWFLGQPIDGDTLIG